MKHSRNTTLALGLLLALTPSLAAQEGPSARLQEGRTPARPAPEARPAQDPAPQRTPSKKVSHSLAQVRGIFSAADKNQDGVIVRSEAAPFGVTERVYAAFDADSNGRVTADEFVAGYREHVVAAGHDAGADLAAEADRIVAARRKAAQEAEAAGSGGSPFDRAPEATPERVRNQLGQGEAELPAADAGGLSERRRQAQAAEDAAKAKAAARLRGSTPDSRTPSTRDGGREAQSGGARPAPSNGPSARRTPAPRPQQPRPSAGGSQGNRPAPAPAPRAGRSGGNGGGQQPNAGRSGSTPAPRAGGAKPKSGGGRSSRG